VLCCVLGVSSYALDSDVFCGWSRRTQAQRIPFVDIFDRTPQQSTNKRKAAVSSSAAALKGPSTPKKPRQQPVEDEYGYDDCC
jgi:hypothetical protein